MIVLDEAGRLRLYCRLEAVLGTDEAEVLMAQLPVRGWDDVATKNDVAGLRVELKSLEEGMDVRFASLEERMDLRFRSSKDETEARSAGFEERMGARIAVLEERVTLGFGTIGDRIRGEVGALEHTLITQARVQLVTYLGFVVAFAAALIAALRVH
jgi:hypothetical protein